MSVLLASVPPCQFPSLTVWGDRNWSDFISDWPWPKSPVNYYSVGWINYTFDKLLWRVLSRFQQTLQSPTGINKPKYTKTQKDAFPLPRNKESLDTFSGAQWFATIDLTGSCNQVPVAEQDCSKTAFCFFEFNHISVIDTDDVCHFEQGGPRRKSRLQLTGCTLLTSLNCAPF